MNYLLNTLFLSWKTFEHTDLIEEWKQNIDDTAYEKYINRDVKITSIKEKLIVMVRLNTGQQA